MSSLITIAWNAVPGVQGYNVYRGTSSGNESPAALNGMVLVPAPTFTDNSVVPGQVYFYEVTAVEGGVESVDSLEIQAPAVPFPATPAPPTGLSSLFASSSSAGLVLQDLTYLAVTPGSGGDAITIAYVNPLANSQSLSVTVNGDAITVNLATNASGALISTASQIQAAIAASLSASALVTAFVSGTGSNVQAATVLSALGNGITLPTPTGSGLLSFGVLAGSTVTNVPGTPTLVLGDVGVSPGTSITGFGAPAAISGVFQAGNFVAAAGQSLLSAAYSDAQGRVGGTTMLGDIGGETLSPGIYTSASSLGITGVLILDAKGDPNAVWIFQIGSTLTTAASNSVIVTVGGAQAANVFWAVGSSATLGTDTVFQGTIMAQASITVGTGADINGRLLAMSGAITMGTNEVYAFMAVDPPALVPSAPNVAPAPPAAPTDLHITAET